MGFYIELREPVMVMSRERHKQKTCKADSIDVPYRDGQVRSSDEGVVMTLERRDLVTRHLVNGQLFFRRNH